VDLDAARVGACAARNRVFNGSNYYTETRQYNILQPEMKPRTLGVCLPVAIVIALRLAPSARRISFRTMAFLLPSRGVGAAWSTM
jgi:hypothetical protein